jgi:hypothetical protein
MLFVHLSVNNKPALIDIKNILFIEECAGQNENKEHIEFTRIYLKQALAAEEPITQIDIVEKIDKLLKLMK